MVLTMPECVTEIFHTSSTDQHIIAFLTVSHQALRRELATAPHFELQPTCDFAEPRFCFCFKAAESPVVVSPGDSLERPLSCLCDVRCLVRPTAAIKFHHVFLQISPCTHTIVLHNCLQTNGDVSSTRTGKTCFETTQPPLQFGRNKHSTTGCS